MKVDNVSIILIIVILMLVNKDFKLSVCNLINSLGLSNLIENFTDPCDGLMGPAKTCCENCDNSCNSLPSFAKSSSMSRGNCSETSSSSGNMFAVTGKQGGSVTGHIDECEACLSKNCNVADNTLINNCGATCLKDYTYPQTEQLYNTICN